MKASLKKLSALLLPLMLEACPSSQTPPAIQLSPALVSPGSSTLTSPTAIDPLCESLIVIAISGKDEITKGTVNQIEHDNAAIMATCPLPR